MNRPQALFFDVNETLLDLNALKSSVAGVLGGRDELLPLWFRMMLHYSLVATVGDQYHNFGEIGAAALMMVARNQGIELSHAEAKASLSPIRSLPPHADVAPALGALQQAGYRMFTLTNSSFAGVDAQMKNAGLTDFFEERLSVEAIQIFKPHTHVYRWAAKRLGLQPEDCMMIAAHGWDVAGAMWAGMRAAFISRPGQQMYPLAERPEIVVDDMGALVERLVGRE